MTDKPSQWTIYDRILADVEARRLNRNASPFCETRESIRQLAKSIHPGEEWISGLDAIVERKSAI
jgi:hypothetical protein